MTIYILEYGCMVEWRYDYMATRNHVRENWVVHMTRIMEARPRHMVTQQVQGGRMQGVRRASLCMQSAAEA